MARRAFIGLRLLTHRDCRAWTKRNSSHVRRGLFGYSVRPSGAASWVTCWARHGPKTVPIITVLFCLPRWAYSSYLGRGFVAAIAFAIGAASGVDYGDIDPQAEVTPALTFILTWFFSCVCLLAGLLPLGVAKLIVWM